MNSEHALEEPAS